MMNKDGLDIKLGKLYQLKRKIKTLLRVVIEKDAIVLVCSFRRFNLLGEIFVEVKDIRTSTFTIVNPEDLKEIEEPPKGNLKTESSKDPDSHYATRIQPIEFMQANFTPEEFLGYLKGTVIKYTARMSRKGQSESDARKLKRFSSWVKQAEAGQIIDPRKED